MLTKQQLEAAQFWTHRHADPEIECDLAARAYIYTALSAYERVAALLDGWSHEDMNGPGWVPSVVVDELRRAVEGK